MLLSIHDVAFHILSMIRVVFIYSLFIYIVSPLSPPLLLLFFCMVYCFLVSNCQDISFYLHHRLSRAVTSHHAWQDSYPATHNKIY